MNGTQVPTDAGFRINAAFDPTKIAGNAGCNTYNGTYVLTGTNGFAIKGELVLTSKICTGPADVAEAEYLTSLVQVTKWNFDDPAAPTRLALQNDDGTVKLAFTCPKDRCPLVPTAR